MQAVCYEKPYVVTVREVSTPTVGPEDVLIRVEAAGICGTDIHLYQGAFEPKYPLIPGHEFAGVVTKVGAHVTAFQLGERVAVDPNLYCDQCYFCRQNMQNHCQAWDALGVTLPGGFAEFVIAPQRSVYSIGSLSFIEGAFIEPLACVVYGQKRANMRLGDSLLIFGAGPIGLLHLQLGLRSGVASVTVVDLLENRLKLAHQLGAEHTVLGQGDDLSTKLQAIAPYGFDVIVDATGVSGVVERAASYLKNGGKLLVFGVCPSESEIKLNPYDIYRRDLHIIGSFALRKSFGAAKSLLASKAIDVSPLVGDTVNLRDFPEVLETIRQGQTPMKILVDPQNRQRPFMSQAASK